MQTLAINQRRQHEPRSHSLGRSRTPGPVHQTQADEPDAGLRTAGSPRLGFDFSRIALRAPDARVIQRKLELSTPGDEYEQEADHVSEQVMRMPESQPPRAGAAGQHEQSTQRPGLQTRRVSGGAMGQADAPPFVHEVLRSPGQRLDPATRSFMEPRFGHDFGKVQVHTDENAAASARALNAQAYTIGNHIVLARSEGVTPSRSLLAHELAHTLQQDRGPALIQRSPGPSPWKNDVRAARYRGQLMAHRLRTHTKLSKEARQKINAELALFEGAAKDAYLAEVKPALFEVVPIEMPAADVSKPFKAPTPLPLIVDPTDPSMCGGGQCYTDADAQALLDEQKPKESPETKRAIDDQLDELRKKTADWGGYQAFAVSLLEMALREKELKDPRSVGIVIQRPILARYRAWLLAIDAARMERWKSGQISASEERHLRGNGDLPDKSWFAKDGNQHGPSAMEDLRTHLVIDENAGESAVDHVYYQVREYRQRTDPHQIEMAGLAGDMVNVFVGLATGIGAGVNAGEPMPPGEPGGPADLTFPRGTDVTNRSAFPPPETLADPDAVAANARNPAQQHPDSSAIPEAITDEPTTQPLTSDEPPGEVVGDYRLQGQTIPGKTFVRRILGITRIKPVPSPPSTEPLFKAPFESFIEEARASGAERLRVTIETIRNPTVIKRVDEIRPWIQSLGGEVNRLDAMTVEVTVPLQTR